MAIELGITLRKALAELQAERTKISRQIAAIQRVLAAEGPRRSRVGRRAAARTKRTRRAMSAKARKALSLRMKAYWANRRKATADKAAK